MSSVETMPKMLVMRENPKGPKGSKGPCRLRTREPHSCLSCRGAYSHFVQLFIHIFIIFIVLAQLCDQSPIGQGEELRALKEVQKAIRPKKHKRKSLVSLGQPQCSVRIQSKVVCVWWERATSPVGWPKSVPRPQGQGGRALAMPTTERAIKGTSHMGQSLFQHIKVGFC